MSNGTALIVNPAAANGRVGRNLESIRHELLRTFPDAEILLTKAAGEGETLALDAAERGVRRFFSVGGDGTHNEVVNGIVRGVPGDEEPATLGVLPAGTGGDFRRILLHSSDVKEVLASIGEARAHRVDVGKAEFVTDSGKEKSRYFLNIASCGIGGLVDRIVNSTTKAFGGTASFFFGTARALFQYSPPAMSVRVDGEKVFEGKVTNVLVCNGRYAGGGMLFAPHAMLDDGGFTVVVIPSSSVARQLILTPKLYDGSYLETEQMICVRGETLTVTPLTLDEPPAFMDIDGEAPGRAPARFEALPGRIHLLNASPDVLCNPT